MVSTFAQSILDCNLDIIPASPPYLFGYNQGTGGGGGGGGKGKCAHDTVIF